MRGLVADTRPLRNDHFRRLWVANIITVVGAQLTVVAVPAQIYADTGSSAYVAMAIGMRAMAPAGVEAISAQLAPNSCESATRPSSPA